MQQTDKLVKDTIEIKIQCPIDVHSKLVKYKLNQRKPGIRPKKLPEFAIDVLNLALDHNGNIIIN